MPGPEDEDFEGGDHPRLCQACHEAPAAVRVIWVKDGEEVEAWLCRECAGTDVV